MNQLLARNRLFFATSLCLSFFFIWLLQCPTEIKNNYLNLEVCIDFAAGSTLPNFCHFFLFHEQKSLAKEIKQM